ncbi:hypothetical protein B7P43_G07793 [Cryptotermes secundus]|uniref:BHLH domain-containing protein n=1 Tax=Cryptotermes secundus TaxID=105785 RepID=A0A2J7PJH6_9NEOP|nr:uncharacterized protein LOC111873547 isoform X2 [Cryptotermes secundus]PNF16483.1 hypothetical protein B7P43_G07793 [Cryptotermes secundus]
MPKKELSSKSRIWERDRRERLNVSFNNLSALLPNYDPAATLSKVEILQKAANYIHELQQENHNLLHGSVDEFASKQMQHLKQQVEELVKRIQQLVNLLRDARISIPPHLAVDSSRPLRWSNKFNQEDGLMLFEKAKKKKAEQKNAKIDLKKKKKLNRVQTIRTNAAAPLKPIINNCSKVTQMKQITNTSNIPSIPKKKSTVCKKSKDKIKSGKPATKLFGDKLPTVAQLLGLTMNDIDTSPAAGHIDSTTISVHEPSNVARSTLINTSAPLPPGFIVIQGSNGVQQTSLRSTSVMNHHQAQSCIVMPTNPQIVTAKKVTKSSTVSQPIPFVLSNSTSNNAGINKRKLNSLISVTKSHLLTAPVVASGIQTCPPPAVLTNHSTGLAGLRPGTLILANGNIVPVLPQPQTVLTAAPTQFIVNSNPLPPPANPPVLMMHQQKNAVTRTTSSNSVALVTSSCSKPQQRSFPMLVPKVSKKPANSDTTVTTFANKVPIPALTSRHQPVKCQHIQAPAINTLTKSPAKAKTKGDNESVKTANTDLPVLMNDRVRNSGTKNTTACKGRERLEKIINANKNSKQRSLDRSTVRVSITDVNVDSSGANKDDSLQVGAETDGKLSEKFKDKDVKSNGADRTLISHNVTNNDERNCEQVNNLDAEIEDGNKDEEEGPAGICENPAPVKRKRECEKESSVETCNKTKQWKCDTENQEARNTDMETNNSATYELCSAVSDRTSPSAVAALKSCNSGTYTIDVLCMTKPVTCLSINKISGESTRTESNVDITNPMCSEKIIPSEGDIKYCSQKEHDTVKLTAKDSSTVSEVCRLNAQVVSKDSSKPVTRSESQVALKSPLNTCSASGVCQHEVRDRTDKQSSSTTSDFSVPQQVHDMHITVIKSQLFKGTELNTLPQSPQPQKPLEVTNPRVDFKPTVKAQQNNVIKASSDSFSLQNEGNIENEGIGTSLQKSTELPSSSTWHKDKESVVERNNSTNYHSLAADQASHTEQQITASVLPQHHHEIRVAATKEHDLCNAHSVVTCTSLTIPENKLVRVQTESSELCLDKALLPVQSSSMYPTFTSSAMATHCSENTFIPITSNSADIDTGSKTTDSEANINNSLNISLQNSEFSSDLFASLQVPSSGQHSESISPTAAFLLAFPLVSSSKVTEMIVDPQEEVGSDSMQGASTLLQIGNIEPDPPHHMSKPPHSADVNVPTETTETVTTRTQPKIAVSSSSAIADGDNVRAVSSGCNVPNQQRVVLCSNRERKTENSVQETQNLGKCSSGMTLPLENFTKASDKQWPNVTEHSVLECGDKLHPRRRSIGTQSNIFNNLELKSSEANCSQTSLSSTIKTSLAIDASVYNISLDEEKDNTSGTCFQQKMETENTAVSTNNTPQHPVSSSHSHITIFKSGQEHQEYHSSSNSFQLPPTFGSVIYKNVLSEDSTKKITGSSNTFQPMEELCMKPQTAVTSEHNRTCANTNFTQTFHTSKESHHTCEDLPHNHTSGNTVTDHNANQNSFPKMHPSQMITEQGTMTEESRDHVGSANYKPLTSSTSAASSVGEVIKHNFSNNVTNSASHADMSVSYNHVLSSTPAQTYPYNLFSNDYSSVPSQVTCTATYIQAPNSNDQNKTSAASFSVAHNSSNFSILSWTTLSPMSAPANINQYENFNIPLQNTSADVPQHNSTTGTSLQKEISQNQSSNNAATMSSPAVSEMQRLVHSNNCQKQRESNSNVGKSMNDEIHKLTGSFPGLYTSEEQQSLGMSDRDTATSHMQFHHVNNENQVSVPQEEGANNENFKFPLPSVSDVKSRQTARTNHSTERMKVSQQHRPPVNWMTTPDIRTSSTSCSAMSSTSSSAAPIGQPTISHVPSAATSAAHSETSSVQMNKEFEFCSNTSNHNLFMGNSSVASPTFDGRSFAGNVALYGNHVLPSHSNLYTNNRQSSRLSYHKEETRNMHHNPTHQRLTNLPVHGQNYHNEAYSLSWTPRKVPFTSASVMAPDMNGNNFVPSTLPTLIGDLALGTNYPVSGNDDSNHNKPYVHSNFGNGEINKKNASVNTLEDLSGKHIQSRHVEKESGINTDIVGSKARNNSNQVCTQDYHGSAQSEGGSSGGTSAVSGNFLSVSQLVDQVKSGVGSSRTQVNASARRSNNNRNVSGGNKNSTAQSRQHVVASSSNKRSSTTQNNTERDSSKKQQQVANVSFSVPEGTNAMPITGDGIRKANDGNRDSHFSTENATTLMPPISQSSASFPMPVHDMGNQPPSSIANNQHHWPLSRGKQGRTGSASYKAPVSNYSAEALIGLSSSTLHIADTAHLSQESTNNKIISLPPPMVSERFCHNQNYHHHPQTSRSLQMTTSFGNEAIIAGNYFPPVDLPSSHHQDGHVSGIPTNTHHDNFTQTPHQNQQSYSNASFSYPAGPANMNGQGPATLYPSANFISSSNSGHTNASIPPVSLPTGFLTELTGSNTFPGGIIPSDSNNSLIFPSPVMKSVPVNRNSSSRHNHSYLQSSTSASAHHHDQSGQQLQARNDNSSGQVGETNRSGSTNMTSNDGHGNRRLNGHAGGLPLHHQTNNLGGSSNTNCSLIKQRGNGSRRRNADPVSSTSSSTSGITGLVDLGYLPMPPGIGSPMLGADDGAFLSHHTSGTFLTPPGPQLYPPGPTPNPQGTLYPPTPRPPTQMTSHTNQHSGSHLPPFSSCTPVQENSSLSRAAHHQQQQQQQASTSPNATNGSGNTLANFNLSTIFPEINDKQIPSVPSVIGFATGTKNLAPESSSSNNSHHHSALLPPGGSDTEYLHRVVPPPSTVPSNCLPPPPVPLHTNFNNLLSHASSQVSRMPWP